jgi:hypothetical protein
MTRAILFLSILILVACSNGPGDEGFIPTTQILRVEVEPDTVSRGGFVTFTCVIKDSLSTEFNYKWHIVGVMDTLTQTNKMRMQANSTKYQNIGIVNVWNINSPWNSINKEFSYYVRQ